MHGTVQETQLQQLKADADSARQEMRQAQREAADVRAKLIVQEEVHKQEFSEMRRRVAVTAAAACEEDHEKYLDYCIIDTHCLRVSPAVSEGALGFVMAGQRDALMSQCWLQW